MKKIISNIVFTKNRPLQLHAYLESLYRFLPAQLIQTYVIYKVELFEQQYEKLFQRFPACVVIKEKDFHSDFLGVLDRVDTPYVLFGIDDVVYFDSVDFDLVDKTFRENSDDIFGFPLRFGLDMFRDTGDVITDIAINGQNVHRVNWKIGKASYSRYPFELCTTVYKTDLVKKILYGTMNNNPLVKKFFAPSSFLVRNLGKVVSMRSTLKSFGYFFNPNTLESWNCRWCQSHGSDLPSFLYFQNQRAIAIQVNMVNVTPKIKCENYPQFTVQALAEKYRQDWRLDIDFVAKRKPSGTHAGPEVFQLRQNS